MGSLTKAAQAAEALHKVSGRLYTELQEGRGDFTRLVALADEIGEQGDVLAAAFYEVDQVLTRLVSGDDPVVPAAEGQEPAEAIDEAERAAEPEKVASELRAIVDRLAELERRLDDGGSDRSATATAEAGIDPHEVAKTNGSGGMHEIAMQPSRDERVTNGARASEAFTRADLYHKAREADVPGRSRMSKDELAQALRGSKGGMHSLK